MNAKRIVTVLCFCASLALGAAERHWTGGDGVWSAVENWQDGTLPSSGDSIVFDNASAIVVSLDQSASVYVGGLSATANVTITNAEGYAKGFILNNGATLSVGADATMRMAAPMDAVNTSSSVTNVKAGAGTFVLASPKTSVSMGVFDVREGLVCLQTCSGDSFVAPKVHVCGGAEVRCQTINGVGNNVPFDLDENARLRLTSDTLGPITGKGLCYTTGGQGVSMVLPEGTTETGVAFSNITVYVSASSNNQKLRLTNNASFAAAYLQSQGTYQALVLDRRYRDWTMAAFSQASSGAFNLENEAGDPIVLTTSLQSSTGPICGSGRIVHTANSFGYGNSPSFSANVFKGPGEAALEKGYFTFYDLSDGTGVATPNGLSKLTVNNGHNGIVFFRGSKASTVTTPIYGTGRVDSRGSGKTTLESLNLSSGSIFWATGPTEVTGGSSTVGNTFVDGGTVRLSGTASLSTGAINFQQDVKKTGALSRLEIGTGATLRLSSAWAAIGGGSTYLTSTCLAFDGGRLTIGASSSYTVIPFPTASDHRFTVGTDPALFRTDTTSTSQGATFAAPLVADCEGTDGGLVKDGLGRLDFSVPLQIAGPVVVAGGRFSSSTADTSVPPFGTGPVTVRNGLLALSGANAQKTLPSLTFGAAAELYFEDTSSKSATGAAIGALTAEDDASVLILRAEANGKRPSAGYTVTTTSRTGGTIVATDDSGKTLSLVTRDATSGELGVAACAADYTAAATETEDKTVASARVAAALTLSDGVTLTVGDDGSPAPVLMDGTASVTGGTLDFGSSRGAIVAGPGAKATVASGIAGTGGLVLAGLYDQPATVTLSGTMDYSGGTVVAGAYVVANTAFGSGTVTVRGGTGGGGTLVLDSSAPSTFANDLDLSGDGVWKDSALQGALRVGRDVAFSGGVRVSGETAIALCNGASATLSGALSGTSSLTLKGTGALALSAASGNYHGSWSLADQARLAVASGDALGTGNVAIGASATLAFTNAGDITVTNKLTGTGTIALNGAGKVTFTNAAEFKGKVTGTGSYACDGDFVFQAGSGVNDRFDGILTGDSDLIKDGASTLRLTKAGSYAGATHVKAGTLSLGTAGYVEEYIADSAVLHLDASKTSTITFGDDAHTNIYKWADADGRALSADVPSADLVRAFDYHADSVTNRAGDVLSTAFNPAANQNYLAFTGTGTSKYLQTFIAVLRPAKGSHPLGSWNFAGVYGGVSSDSGIRIGTSVDSTSYVYWEAGSLDSGGTHYVNGVLGKKFDKDAVSVSTIELTSSSRNQIASKAIGDYWHDATNRRCYWGDMCEIIGFDGILATADRQAVENYLMGKWGVTDPSSEEAKMTDVLPATTVLTVDDGAVVELNGSDQTLAGLFGHGTIRNSSSTPSVITLTGDSRFDGTFEGDITVLLADGVTLDLNDGAVTVRSVGGSGAVAFGTLTVTDRVLPGGTNAIGTLTFATAPVLADATIEIDLRAGAADAVVVASGDADVSAANLSVLEREAYTGRKPAIFSCADGILTGPFAETALPNPSYSVLYKDDRALLKVRRGTVIFLR